MGISGHLTCLLRNLYAGQKGTVRIGNETTEWLQIGKGVRQGFILSPCLFNLYAEYIMRNAGLDEAHLLYWQADSFPLKHQGSPHVYYILQYKHFTVKPYVKHNFPLLVTDFSKAIYTFLKQKFTQL